MLNLEKSHANQDKLVILSIYPLILALLTHLHSLVMLPWTRLLHKASFPTSIALECPHPPRKTSSFPESYKGSLLPCVLTVLCPEIVNASYHLHCGHSFLYLSPLLVSEILKERDRLTWYFILCSSILPSIPWVWVKKCTFFKPHGPFLAFTLPALQNNGQSPLTVEGLCN